MQLLRLLQEASSLGIDDLKKAMRKDDRAAPIFKKELSLDSIDDKEAFLSSLKFYLFNNERVKDFVASRDNIKDVDIKTFMEYRKLRGPDLTQAKLDWLREFVQNIFKEHGSVVKGTLSKDLRDQLKDWFNTSGRYFSLPEWAMRELKSVPGVRPDKRVVLYRGLLFSEDSLKEREKYDGTLEVGNGLKFLRSVRADKKVVDLKWDRPSSWTKSKDVAERFAKYGPAHSQFGAMMQWFDRAKNERAIDGALGYVISTIAEPEDILIDAELFNSRFHMSHGDEQEVILAPGERACRIVKKYTVEGEVDPEASSTADGSTIVELAKKVADFTDSLVVPITDKEESGGLYHYAITHLRNIKRFEQLANNGTTTKVMHSWEKTLDFYKDAFKGVTKDDLRADKYADDEKLRQQAAALLDVYKWFNEPIKHSSFGDKKKGPLSELSAEELRATISAFDLSSLEKPLLLGKKVTDSQAGRAISDAAHYLNVDIPSSAKPHMFGTEKQGKMIDDIIAALFKKLGMELSENRMDNVRTFINIVKKAYRNYDMNDSLERLKEKLQKVKDAVQ